MTKQNETSLTQQQTIDRRLIIGLWITLAWVAVLRAPVTAMGIMSAFFILPLALFIGVPLILLIASRVKKYHAANDHLPTAVRGSLIAFMLCMVAYTLSLTDSYDIGSPFSTLTMYSGGVISADVSHVISLFSLMSAGIALLTSASIGAIRPIKRL